MPALSAIVSFLDRYMKKEEFSDHLPIGLLVEGRPEVGKVATGVSACVDLFRQASEWGADMVLVHHGMFWKDSDPVLRGHHKKRVKFLLEHDLSLVGYHLPLDAHPEVGNNALFAGAMGWREVEPFGLYEGTSIGYRGTMDPTPIGEFVAKAAEFYGHEPVAFLEGKEEITSAGVISGGAWDHLPEAAREGLDCLVTGNADEPVPQMAREEAIHFLSFGHYATERVGIERLGEVVAKEFDLEVRFFDVENPL